MTDLLIDDAALEGAVDALRGAAGAVRHGPSIEPGGCGSATVGLAVSRFGLWTAVTAQRMDARLRASAADAETVVLEFRELDAEIAAGAY